MLYIYQFAKQRFTSAMNLTNNEIRKLNLLLLIDEVGKKSDLAKIADTDPAYISQILSKKNPRNIGDDLARKLEKGCRKPRGWMDTYHDKTPTKQTALQQPTDSNAAPTTTLEDNGQWTELAHLMATATPRTHAILETIAQAWRDGALTEDDLKLLDTIARRLAHDKSRQDR